MTSKARSELERRVKTLEHSLAEVNGRLNDDERQVAELQSSKTKAEKEIESLVSQLDEAEEKHRTLEREKATLASQLQDAQVRNRCLGMISPVRKFLASGFFLVPVLRFPPTGKPRACPSPSSNFQRALND